MSDSYEEATEMLHHSDRSVHVWAGPDNPQDPDGTHQLVLVLGVPNIKRMSWDFKLPKAAVAEMLTGLRDQCDSLIEKYYEEERAHGKHEASNV